MQEKQIPCEDDRKKGKSNDNCKSVDAKFARLSEVREGKARATAKANCRFLRCAGHGTVPLWSK